MSGKKFLKSQAMKEKKAGKKKKRSKGRFRRKLDARNTQPSAWHALKESENRAVPPVNHQGGQK